MCTKAEVVEVTRGVIREIASPAWVKPAGVFITACAVGFLGWLAYTVHIQESNMVMALGNMRLSSATSNSELLGKIDILASKLENIQMITITKISSRNTLIDERCKSIRERVKKNTETIEKHHKID